MSDFPVVQDSTGEIHAVDPEASTERSEELSNDNETPGVLVSQCTRDILATQSEVKEVPAEQFEDLETETCSDCERSIHATH
jgi:hypothetical protein